MLSGRDAQPHRTVDELRKRAGFHLLHHLYEATGLTNLGLSGGVAYNSVMNGKILLNTPFRRVYVQKLGADMDRQREIVASAAYKEGDPEAVAARYRLHFKPALKRPEDYEKLMARMKAAFISQGKEGIVKARRRSDESSGP